MKRILLSSRKGAEYMTGQITSLHKMQPWLFPVLILLFLLLSSLQEVIDDVIEGDTLPIDTKILESLRNPLDISDPLGPLWLQEVMRDFSALGGIAILTLLTLTAVTYLFVKKKPFKAWFTFAAVASGTALTNILKAGFDRPRPDLVAHETYTYTASFPSGHSMMAAVVYLTLGAILAQNETSHRMKVFILSIAVTMTILVGISRIYLGAHWASDVLAGWLAGSAWALLFWLAEIFILFRQQNRRTTP